MSYFVFIFYCHHFPSLTAARSANQCRVRLRTRVHSLVLAAVGASAVIDGETNAANNSATAPSGISIYFICFRGMADGRRVDTLKLYFVQG